MVKCFLDNGTDINKVMDGPSKQIGVVFQKYSIFEFLTVRENVLFGLELEYFNLWSEMLYKRFPFYKSKKRKEFNEKADFYLAKVDLLKHDSKYPPELSGGQMQRVAIAQAMIMNPPVIVMDEPLGALDPTTRQELQSFVVKLAKEANQTVLFITHDLDEALIVGTRLFILSQYWENGEKEGAKIVTDIPLDWGEERSVTLIGSKEFGKLKKEIMLEGMSKVNLQKVSEFKLLHPDSIIQ